MYMRYESFHRLTPVGMIGLTPGSCIWVRLEPGIELLILEAGILHQVRRVAARLESRKLSARIRRLEEETPSLVMFVQLGCLPEE